MQECHSQGYWHRAVYAFIIDQNSNVLLQKRSKDKKLWPGKWDVIVGGHVRTGEFGRQAVIRECKEELGIEITDDDIKYIVGTTSVYNKNGYINNHYDECYLILKQIDTKSLKLQKDEVEDVKFFTCEDLINRNIDTNKLDEIITFVRNQSNTSYQERTSLDKTLKNHPPIKYIAFDGVFKIFMLYYSIVYKNSIEKETLKSAMMEIADLLKNQGIELEPINNLNLFRSAYDKNRNQNPDNPNRKFSLKDGYVNIKIENFDDFLLEIKGIFNKEILSFIEKIVAYYITSPEFESKITKRKSKEKTKDIK